MQVGGIGLAAPVDWAAPAMSTLLPPVQRGETLVRNSFSIFAMLAATGCVTDAPTGPDTEPPTIEVQV
jgi:hypothetical protein